MFERHMTENDLEKYWTLKVDKNYMNSLVRLWILVGPYGPGSGLTSWYQSGVGSRIVMGYGEITTHPAGSHGKV